VLQEEAAFWGQRLTFVPAVRLEWNEGLGERWLPSLGIVAAPVPWLRIKGNVQSAYRVPSFNELYFPDKGYIRGNPNLAPESGRSADIGLDLILARLGPILDLSFSAAFFVQKIEDSIVWVPISPFTDAPVNMGPAKLHGYELALAFGVTEYLRLSANHTGLRSESSVTGLPLPGRAENETFFRAQLGPPGIWKLTAELHRLGEIPVSASGSRLLPARSVWNASASLNLAGIPGVGLDRFVDELWLYVTLNNISDIAVRDLLFAPQPGRSGYLGMEIQW
jgi:vitamin B12 transporter